MDELTLRVIATACKEGSLLAAYVAAERGGKTIALNIHEIDFVKTFEAAGRYSLLSVRKDKA